MRKTVGILFFLFVLVSIGKAQITTNELPPSYYNNQLLRLSATSYLEVDEPNLKAFKKEDKIADLDKFIPWRFGKIINVDFDINQDGIISNDGKGNSIWKLQIKAPGALSINLNFNQFLLSQNAKLFAYGDSYADVLGAITSKNNKEDQLFAIRPIKGEVIHLELIAPEGEFKENKIRVHELIYGYRSIHEKANKIFRSSGGCNININCDEGQEWQTMKRAIAMITTSSNTRICTGILLNNVREDTIPYLLTGAHCNVPSTSLFIFGYESAKCSPNTDGILTNSVTGATTRAAATSNFTDFELMELSAKPPKSYNVYYAGWSAEGIPSPNSATIHHPSGDVMKVSIDEDTSVSSGYYSKSGNTHWTVGNWEFGTTEAGSSGAPLLNSNQRVIGSLHGGDAGCSNKAEDYYGKFSVSWDDNSSKSRQLKAWLDPDTTGILVLDGLSADTALYANDLAIINIGGINKYFCDSAINPSVFIRNEGNDTIFSYIVEYNINGGPDSSSIINDTILKNELTEVKLPPLSISGGNQTFNAAVKIQNITDGDSSNNKKSFSFLSATQTETITVEVKTDDYGGETSWSLHDLSSDIKISFGGPYASVVGGQTITKSICVPDTNCFYIDLFDSANDGFTGIFGNGYLLVKAQNGDTLSFENNFRKSFKRDTFCINDTFTSIYEVQNNQTPFKLIPNPVKRGNLLEIQLPNQRLNDPNYRILDGIGRTVIKSNSNSIRIPYNIDAGLYFIEIKSSNENLGIQKLLIQ